jgi:hypothetical protein
LQIEQGCDISFSIALGSPYPTEPLDIAGYSFSATLTPEWSPGASPIAMTVAVTDASMGIISITLPGSATNNLPLPAPPMKTAGNRRARNFELGGWQLEMVDTNGFRTRLIAGDVCLQRNSTQGG